MTDGAMPVKASERYAILDILRGFALLGIVLANFEGTEKPHSHACSASELRVKM